MRPMLREQLLDLERRVTEHAATLRVLAAEMEAITREVAILAADVEPAQVALPLLAEPECFS